MNIANFKIGTRLGAGFAVILSLMMGLTAIGINSMRNTQANLDTIVHVNVYKMGLLQEMSESIHIVSRVMRTMVLLTDDAERERQYQKIVAARSKYNESRIALDQTSASEAGKAFREKIRTFEQLAEPVNNKVIADARSRNIAEAVNLLMKDAIPMTQKWQDTLHEYIDLQKQNDEKDVTAAQDAYAKVRMLMFVLTAATLALGALTAWLVTRSITRPLKEAVAVAQTVAAGNLTSRIAVTSKDETGQLLQALKEMNDSLQNIVGQVRLGADTIATASGQIASGNLDLSSRTEQQASSLEETASSMEELTSTVKQNGDNARQANQMAASASEVAVKGGQVVSQVVDTMNSINESAKKIVDIIGVIDGIAFQTNILALNAAVEAARAGEQGRGFAVVASEVRNLAQRSAGAAKEIKSLIGNSVEKVEAGSKLVNQAGMTMDEIVASVKRVTDIMSEITSASHEQEAGIEQINQAITEMDNVTQQNASLVEEAAAAAQSLQDQASHLAKIVSIFKIDGSHRHATEQPDYKSQSTSAYAAAKSAIAQSQASRLPNRHNKEPRRMANAPALANDDWEEF